MTRASPRKNDNVSDDVKFENVNDHASSPSSTVQMSKGPLSKEVLVEVEVPKYFENSDVSSNGSRASNLTSPAQTTTLDHVLKGPTSQGGGEVSGGAIDISISFQQGENISRNSKLKLQNNIQAKQINFLMSPNLKSETSLQHSNNGHTGPPNRHLFNSNQQGSHNELAGAPHNEQEHLERENDIFRGPTKTSLL